MANLLSYVPLVGRLVSSGAPAQTIDIDPVEVHDVETAPEKRPRTLKHLLRANHANHAIIYHNLQFDNHMPHILCSAYLLGASPVQLYKIYDEESQELEPWTDSPEEITADDWRTFLGKRNYQRAYVDFFEDALALRFQYDWKRTVQEFLYKGDEPLVNGLIGGLGHPLIHLGYAYEMNNKEVAMEALGLAACQYNYLHKYTDDPSYAKPSGFATKSLRDILDRLSNDTRFEGIFRKSAFETLDSLFEKHEALILEYWNAWKLSNPLEQFRESQEAARDLLIATVAPGTHSYNFFAVHILTTSHAVRILLPVIPKKFHFKLVRQWWLLALAVYISEKRPKIDTDNVPDDLKGRVWNYVEDKAINSEWATDSHYVKAIRALKEAARTWGDVHDRYLLAAIRFVDDFKGWTF